MSVDLAMVGVGFDSSQVEAGERITVKSFANMGDAAEQFVHDMDRVAHHTKLATEAAQERAKIEEMVAAGQRVKAAAYFESAEREKQAIEGLVGAIAQLEESEIAAAAAAEASAARRLAVQEQLGASINRTLAAERAAHVENAQRSAEAEAAVRRRGQLEAAAAQEDARRSAAAAVAARRMALLEASAHAENAAREAAAQEAATQAEARARRQLEIQQQLGASITRLMAAERAAYAEDAQRSAAAEASLRKRGLLEIQAHAENEKRLNATGATAAKSATGLRTAQNALNQLAISAAGIPGPIGRVVSSLSRLAIGGGITVAVVAGISAIVAVIAKMGEEEREAKKRTDELIASLLKASSVRTGQQWAEDMAAVTGRVRELRAEIEAVDARLAARANGGRFQFRGLSQWMEGRRDAAQAELDDAQVAQSEQLLDGLRRRSEINQRLARERQQAADEAKRDADEHYQQVAQLASLERAVALARAQQAEDLVTIEAIAYDEAAAALDSQLRSMDRLSAADRERYRLLGLQLVALQSQAEVTKRAAEVGTITHRNYLEDNNRATQANVDFESAIKERAEKEWLELRAEMQKRAEEAAKQRYEAALRTTTDAFQRGFTGIWEHGLDGFKEFFDAVVRLAIQAAASIAASMTVRALGLDTLLKNLTGPNGGQFWKLGEGFKGRGAFAGNAFAGFAAGQIGGSLGASQSSGFSAAAVGGLSGAAAGFTVGGPIGGIVGGVTGMVSGLLGQGARAKEAARALAEAQKSFDTAMDAYIAAISGNRLEQALTANQAQVDALKKQATDIARQQLAELSAGEIADGAAGPIIAEWQRTMDEIGEASGAMVEKLKAEEAYRKQIATEDLQVRLLRANGDEAGAAAMQRQLDREREYQLAVKDGMDAQYLALLTQVQLAEEMAFQLAEAQRIAEKITALREDLSVRALRASGQDEEAQLVQEAIERQREYNQAVLDGIDAVTLATLTEVQAAEAARLAADRAKAKAEADADFRLGLLRRRAELSGDDEGLRYVRAAELQRQQDAERAAAQKLVDAGRITQEEFATLEQILRDEFVAALDDTAAAAQRAAQQMQDSVAALNQEFDVFQTGLAEQVRKISKLYGFDGLSVAQLQDRFTTIDEAGPGGLTPAEQAANDQIANFLRLQRQFDAEQAREEETADSVRQRASNNGTVYAGEINLTIEIRVDQDDLRNTERLAERVAARINREFGGRASLLKGAAGRA